MFLDFVEIGTSDFDMELDKAPNNYCGLSIEPISYYKDKLTNRGACIKIDMAVSNFNGVVDMYYVPESIMQRYNLPNWVKGCNTINKPHPTVVKYINDAGLNIDDIFVAHQVNVSQLKDILISNKATGIHLLKVNTEGHDCVILNNYLDTVDNELLAHKIIFESNELSNEDDVISLIQKCKKRGYELIQYGYDSSKYGYNTILELNLTLLKNRSKFTDEINNFYLAEYPPNYNTSKIPHENTLDAAQRYCQLHGFGGVTFENGKYEVRLGRRLNKNVSNTSNKSWINV